MVAGMERVVHFLAVSFPYSNMRWVVALPGETSECVCQGLLEVFERTGMTRVVVFDNATGVGHRNSDGTGRPDPPVLPVLRALRVRAPVLQPVVFVKLKQSRMACRFSPKQRRVLVQLSEKPAAIASSSIPSGRGFACTTLPRT